MKLFIVFLIGNSYKFVKNMAQISLPPALKDISISDRPMVRIHPALLARVKAIAADKGMTQTAMLEALLQIGIEQVSEDAERVAA
jgi:hypothetical protein